ncbi:hypothetical protein [Limnoglobus roseus]|uniref:Carboxypeptidase regulatory-like domain-containing protein n=1 Tax=Limnoglobus roseus TaxID=2598579 RepID=A0A5C1AJR3_9BACT|nr:hypothetical protein [Limnoglobus roseus]QEL19639.1 hypothetical protein PX52LOC_06716 [Limnoglobus roseus]
MIRRRWPAVLALSLLLPFAGCGDTPAVGELHPLTGTVHRQGRPASRGGIIFTPISGTSGGWVFDASVNADGTFAARTSRLGESPIVFRPGIRVGAYRVTYHPTSDGSKMGLDVDLPDPITVEVKDNHVDLTLPDEMPKGMGAPRDDAPAAANIK